MKGKLNLQSFILDPVDRVAPFRLIRAQQQAVTLTAPFLAMGQTNMTLPTFAGIGDSCATVMLVCAAADPPSVPPALRRPVTQLMCECDSFTIASTAVAAAATSANARILNTSMLTFSVRARSSGGLRFREAQVNASLARVLEMNLLPAWMAATSGREPQMEALQSQLQVPLPLLSLATVRTTSTATLQLNTRTEPKSSGSVATVIKPGDTVIPDVILTRGRVGGTSSGELRDGTCECVCRNARAVQRACECGNVVADTEFRQRSALALKTADALSQQGPLVFDDVSLALMSAFSIRLSMQSITAVDAGTDMSGETCVRTASWNKTQVNGRHSAEYHLSSSMRMLPVSLQSRAVSRRTWKSCALQG
ncbi:MAG: hypothetical protein MHM6MM_005311 [Cercozoa sp. M6MM]